jgi:hypothetical protein
LKRTKTLKLPFEGLATWPLFSVALFGFSIPEGLPTINQPWLMSWMIWLLLPSMFACCCNILVSMNTIQGRLNGMAAEQEEALVIELSRQRKGTMSVAKESNGYEELSPATACLLNNIFMLANLCNDVPLWYTPQHMHHSSTPHAASFSSCWGASVPPN